MANASRSRSWIAPLLAIALLLWALNTWLPAFSLTPAALDQAEQLRGSWLREYSDGRTRVRRVLALGADGAFREEVRVVDDAGHETAFVHEGAWFYDGTNLKRRYTSMNGQPVSRLRDPFATFEIAFGSRNDFVGVDHVRGHRVEYHRVQPGTHP